MDILPALCALIVPYTTNNPDSASFNGLRPLGSLWYSLALDQSRSGLGGTNNACERLIGWWIKERYRTMRGYKREEPLRNVASLTAHIGAAPAYYDLTELVA